MSSLDQDFVCISSSVFRRKESPFLVGRFLGEESHLLICGARYKAPIVRCNKTAKYTDSNPVTRLTTNRARATQCVWLREGKDNAVTAICATIAPLASFRPRNSLMMMQGKVAYGYSSLCAIRGIRPLKSKQYFVFLR